MKCFVNGCLDSVYAKGLCGKHYQRLRITGTVEDSNKGAAPIAVRFLRYVDKGSPGDCWVWTGAKTSKGYGGLQEGGRGSKMLLAHRVSYEIHKGPLADGMLVLHSCDNPSCVNPDHLRAGTQSENIKEAFSKGRKYAPKASGDDNPKSKITAVQVAFIKANPAIPHTELARLFGVSPNCIRGVRIGRTWKDSKSP